MYKNQQTHLNTFYHTLPFTAFLCDTLMVLAEAAEKGAEH